MPEPLALVTGGASGIGEAASRALARRGWRVVTCDLAPKGPWAGHDAVVPWPTPVDVADPGCVTREMDAIERVHGPVDGLVNAAGILGKMHPPERVRVETWNLELAVDLTGTFLACREIGSRMSCRGRGSIVNVASIAGMTTAPAHAYAAAKAAVIQLTGTLAAEWGRSGVRVNAVSPGFTRTPALEAGLAAGALDEVRLTRGSAMGRLVEADEVAMAIAWLLGGESSGVTGANVPVDAGFLVGATWDAYGGFRS